MVCKGLQIHKHHTYNKKEINFQVPISFCFLTRCGSKGWGSMLISQQLISPHIDFTTLISDALIPPQVDTDFATINFQHFGSIHIVILIPWMVSIFLTTTTEVFRQFSLFYGSKNGRHLTTGVLGCANFNDLPPIQ